MVGRWALLSARGGTGVSTACANLARALARRGNSTLLVDLRPSAPAQDFLCGVSEQVIYAVTDVVGGTSVTEASLPLFCGDRKPKRGDPPFGALRLLPMAMGCDATIEELGACLRSVVREVHPRALLVDTDAAHLSAVSDSVDGVLLLVSADELSLRAAEALALRLGEMEKRAAFLLCGADLSKDGVRAMVPLLDIIERVGLPLLGILPQSVTVRHTALPVGDRRYGEVSYARAIENVAARLAGEMRPLLDGISLDGIGRYEYLVYQGKPNSTS